MECEHNFPQKEDIKNPEPHTLGGKVAQNNEDQTGVQVEVELGYP